MKNLNVILETERKKQIKKQKFFYIFFLIVIFFSYIFALTNNGTKIIVSPKSAKENLKIKSKSFLDLGFRNYIYSFSSTPSFILKSKGYKDFEGEIPKDRKGKFYEIKMLELPGIIEIDTNSRDNNTKWFINKKYVQTKNKFKKELEPGKYLIEIKNPYFEEKKINIQISRGQNKKININLKEIDGFIKFETVPSNSRIYINEGLKGETPFIFNGKGGEYKLKIEKNGYSTVNENIELTNSEKILERKYFLNRIKGSLSIDVKPLGGLLSLNGIIYNNIERIDLDSGKEYSLTYSKDGYKKYSKKIKLKAKEVLKESIELKKQFGEIEIVSIPKAEIWINNNFIGNTPKKINLQTTSQNIEIKQKDFRTIKKTIIPSKKNTKIINVKLEKENIVKLREAKKEYKNSLGINLKLYNPKQDTIKLGANRYERGQRANEIIREITLAKPFYVSVYEITNKEFDNFIKKDKNNFPVNNISWIQAAKFCNWLSKKEKLELVYKIENNKLISFDRNANGYRLPTEAEWEWLSKKAKKEKVTKFSWGDTFDIPNAYCNIADESAKDIVKKIVKNYNDGFKQIAEVGSFRSEISGLFDLSGNLSEWVHDYYSISFSKKRLIDPMGDKNGVSHVVKGANWSSGSISKIKSSFRTNSTKGSEKIGFRVARYL